MSSSVTSRRARSNSTKSVSERASGGATVTEEPGELRAQQRGESREVVRGVAILVLFVLVNVALLFGTYTVADRMPSALPSNADASVFSEARAKAHLLGLARVARRSWAGTKANDAAADYIAREMRVFEENGVGVRVEVDVQQVSGVTEFDIAGAHMTNVYNNLTNVVVRLRFGDRAVADPPAILVNSHFDTPLASDGAVDARAPISSMMETIRALLHSTPAQLAALARRPVAAIFLFNGGEEILQMASTGFVEQHRWAKTVRTVLNCDAVGVRGGAVLFQSGGMPYLRAYAASVPHPFGTSLAVDIFASGLVQSDTDYRVFVKHGGVSGVDLAIYRESHAYHTHIDTVERLQEGLLQHEGDNMLAYLRHVLTGDLLFEDLSGPQQAGVYFDVLQFFFVLYSKTTATLINAVVGAALFVLVRRDLARLGVPLRAAAYNAFAVTALGYGAVVAVGVVLNFAAPFMWYARMSLLVPFFSLPVFLVAIVYAARRARRATLSLRELERLVYSEAQLVHLFSLALMTAARLGSAYLVMLLCVGHLVAHGIMALSPRHSLLSPLVYLVHALAIALAIEPVMTGVLELFVPLMGRLGPVPADILVAVVVGLMSHGVMFMTPVLAVRIGRARRVALLAFSALFLLVMGASLVLYRDVPFTPDRPRRVYMQHAVRAQPFVDGESAMNERPHFFVAVCDNGPQLPMLREIIANAQALPTTSRLRRLAGNSSLFTSTDPRVVFKPWTQPLDFDAVYPFNFFLTGVVVDGTPISVPAPRFALRRAEFDAARNERHIVVSVDYHEHEAMTFRFRGDLLRWAVWDHLPTQTRGWYVGRCVAGRTGSKTFELDLTFRGNQSVPFQFAGMRFQVNENFAEFVELFPDYVGVGAFTTATTSHLV
jgi:hypothetical protein